jgi:hypothetical protein
MAAYKELIERHPGDSAVPQAKFALARLYEAQNKPELARTYFEEVAQADPYGSVGSEAGMRLEELKIKYPNLVTPSLPPAGTGPAAALRPVAAVPSTHTATNAVPPKTGSSK